MVALFRTLSLRYLRLRWSRAALIVVSILLGVALLVATKVLTGCMERASTQSAAPLNGTADLVVMNGETGVPYELCKSLQAAKLVGVQQVQSIVFSFAGLTVPGNSETERIKRPVVLGVEADLDFFQGKTNPWKASFQLGWRSDKPMTTRDLMLESWRIYGQGYVPVLVGKNLSEVLPDEKGQFTISCSGRVQKLWAVGTVSGEDSVAILNEAIVFLLQDASRVVYGQPQLADEVANPRSGFVTRIHLQLVPEAQQDEAQRRAVRAEVEKLVAGRARVYTSQQVDESIQDIGKGMLLGFSLTGYAALIVGLFLVYNALSVSVAERRQEIGILRSLGGTRLQVGGLFAAEALCLGVTGAALGIPMGWLLSWLALNPLQKALSDLFVPMNSQKLPLALSTIVLAFTAGVVTALIAALLPAWQASREEPAHAVRKVPRFGASTWQRVHLACCVVLVSLGTLAILCRQMLSPSLGGYGGIMLLMLGAMLSTPLWTGLLSRLLQPFAQLLFGLYGRFATDNLARSPGRTGLVIAALASGVALLVQTAGVLLSTESGILGWIETRAVADIFVSSFSTVDKGGSTIPMSPKLADELQADPELRDKIEQVVPLRYHLLDYRDKIVILVAFDANKAYAAQSRGRPVEGMEHYPELAANKETVVVSENFALQNKLKVGDKIELLDLSGRPFTVQIVGLVVDYTWNRGTILMHQSHFVERMGADQIDLFHVYLKPEHNDAATIAAVQQRIQTRWQGIEARTLSKPELRRKLSDLLRNLFNISYAQQIVVALVASLGVVAALLISVLQRRKELGLMRAVGARRPQIIASILVEAVCMGFLGACLGILVGVPLQWLVLRILLIEETGIAFPFIVPWSTSGVVTLLTLLVATCAGLLPAWRAIKLRITDAIAYE